MGATKLAASMQSVTAASGAIYSYSGAAVEQTISDWKLGLTMLQVNEGASNQFTQYGVGVNYTIAPKAIVFLEANSLGATSGFGNAVEFGMKYTF
jgi:outer membrane autotransporter protein